ncbi:PREDICTED: group 10 secretory phospholipase A2 [Pygoscelis adeliae]|nr:PREDICTED: group 10 secretory phospholipase A2 [Pygoscelis adeliae]
MQSKPSFTINHERGSFRHYWLAITCPQSRREQDLGVVASQRSTKYCLRKPSYFLYKGTFGEAHFRNRRGILELAGAIRCTTGRSPFAYLRYGCYCGLGGRGWPKDRVDWCCFNHDCCYGKAEQAGCHPKIESYHWECEDNAVVCESLEDKCQKMACECDREAAKCFSKAPYHTKYLLWPDFMCGEIQPLCRY